MQATPSDEDGNNVYHVTVQAMAGEQMATLEVEVEVTNADDPGMVDAFFDAAGGG